MGSNDSVNNRKMERATVCVRQITEAVESLIEFEKATWHLSRKHTGVRLGELRSGRVESRVKLCRGLTTDIGIL